MLTHVILLRFNDPDDLPEAVHRLQSFLGRIEQVRSLSAGADVRGTENSWDVALITTHDDLAGLQGYLQHPVHVEFTRWLGPRVKDRAVVDFPAQGPQGRHALNGAGQAAVEHTS